MFKFLHVGTAVLLIAVTPVSASIAAVRPNAAIPASASTSEQEVSPRPNMTSASLLPVGIIIAVIALAIYIAATDGSNNGHGTVSRA
jgi:hypothetical protein